MEDEEVGAVEEESGSEAMRLERPEGMGKIKKVYEVGSHRGTAQGVVNAVCWPSFRERSQEYQAKYEGRSWCLELRTLSSMWVRIRATT